MQIMTDMLFSSALRVSTRGMQLWTHYDIMDNLLCNVVGRKRVVMWPPEQVFITQNLFSASQDRKYVLPRKFVRSR